MRAAAVLSLLALAACAAEPAGVVVTPAPAEAELRSGGLIVTDGTDIAASVAVEPLGCGSVLQGGAGYCVAR